ncbi:DUF2474 domain-containing protein [Methylobacterium sp. J-026]|nr:DUF2474 family protein [Methylobacterium sp. J-026]MCJ2133094.1 DUF2474 domain-containing protein [Methylobacterium sp. J-026]
MAPATPLPLWKRLAWFAAIWAGSIVGLGCVATLLRLWLKS